MHDQMGDIEQFNAFACIGPKSYAAGISAAASWAA